MTLTMVQVRSSDLGVRSPVGMVIKEGVVGYVVNIGAVGWNPRFRTKGLAPMQPYVSLVNPIALRKRIRSA